jgi:hypothetical protein
MGVASISYNGSLRITLGIDEGILPKSRLSAKLLLQYFLDELEKLRNEATV